MRWWMSCAAALLVTCGGGAQAAVLCTAGSGSGIVRVRAACRPREVQLDPVALGLQGPPGPSGAPGTPGPSAVVRDANGALVGAVVDIAAIPDSPLVRVVRQVESRTLAFVVGVEMSGFTGFVPLGSFELHYESADCSGSAFLGNYSSYGFPNFIQHAPPVPQVFVHGTLGAYQIGAVNAHAIRSRIAFYDEASCCTNSIGDPVCPGIDGRTFTPPDRCCIPSGPTSENVPEAATVDLASFGLVPPFHVEGP